MFIDLYSYKQIVKEVIIVPKIYILACYSTYSRVNIPFLITNTFIFICSGQIVLVILILKAIKDIILG